MVSFIVMDGKPEPYTQYRTYSVLQLQTDLTFDEHFCEQPENLLRFRSSEVRIATIYSLPPDIFLQWCY